MALNIDGMRQSPKRYAKGSLKIKKTPEITFLEKSIPGVINVLKGS